MTVHRAVFVAIFLTAPSSNIGIDDTAVSIRRPLCYSLHVKDSSSTLPTNPIQTTHSSISSFCHVTRTGKSGGLSARADLLLSRVDAHLFFGGKHGRGDHFNDPPSTPIACSMYACRKERERHNHIVRVCGCFRAPGVPLLLQPCRCRPDQGKHARAW